MRVIISGGGTAGHVYPGLALAKALQDEIKNVEILFVGTENGLESTIVPQTGLPFRPIQSKGLPRKVSLKALLTFFRVGQGMFQARAIIREFTPDVVVGMGAYVSLPIVGIAATQKIPTIIHEQNSVPGMVNKLLSRRVSLIATSYPKMDYKFPSYTRVVCTGNPIRKEILTADRNAALEHFEIDTKRKIIFIFGGSRGAQKINEAAIAAYDRWRDNNRLQIIHATGKINFDHVQGAVDRIRSTEDKLLYKAYPYIENIGQAYAVSDLLVCRSGATTVAEITALGLPALFIPYPYATDNHQEKNARCLEQLGAGSVILDRELDGNKLCKAVEAIVNDPVKLESMRAASKGFGRPDADKELAKLVLDVAET